MYDYWDLKKMYEELKKENQQLKKQKDDVVEYIKTLEIYGYDENAYYIRDLHNKGLYLEELPEVLLRMLGEIE